MNANNNQTNRLFARRVARELSQEELSAVSGAGDHCFVCDPNGAGGRDVKVYERD